VTFSASVIDAAGNVGTAVTTAAVLERGAPTGYSIAASDALVNATEATSTGFTISAAEIGATYDYTVTSSNGGTPVTSNGAITSMTQQITGIDVSSLNDGTLTYSVILTDTLGNVGTAATATTTLDKTAPTGYSITVDQDPIPASDATAVSFTFAGAEVGATYRYTVSGGGATLPAVTGVITLPAQQIAGIDVSSLPAGVLTFTVTLTDLAGNVGVSVTDTATRS
jgi:large repetitive protein